jgi:hypothetical protein
VPVAKHGRPVVVTTAVEESQRLKVLDRIKAVPLRAKERSE